MGDSSRVRRRDDPLEAVFRALADEHRRALLDALRERDGQTLGELCEVAPEITRFGVMKHLRVLEDAHLVVVERVGRTKCHYLNPVPIREIHDRWISRYAEPHVAGLLDLRDRAEGR
jgi:DNA-binding transcriptional ArsR family regulator